MKTKHYDILNMDAVTKDDDERLSIIMREIGELPLAEHLFDVDEMKKIADEMAPLVEEFITNLLERGERLAGEVNRCAGAAFIYLAGKAAMAHADHYARSAMSVIATDGSDLLVKRLGEDGLNRLIEADIAKKGDPASDLISLLIALGVIRPR